jgi:arylsulfatase A-like enzyme
VLSKFVHILVALIWAVAAIMGAQQRACAANEQRPNLVLFVSDDLGYLDTSLAGTTESHKPNLMRIARDGMTFTHAFAVSPSCARYPMRAVRTRDWKYSRNLQPESEHTTHIDLGEAVDGNAYWKSWLEKARTDELAAAIISRYHWRSSEELYDLRNDPLEQHNLAANPNKARVLSELQAQLDQWMESQGDRGGKTGDEPPTP